MIKRKLFTRAHKAGLAPGTPVHIGEKNEQPVAVSVMEYDADGCSSRTELSLDELIALPLRSTVTWINVDGVHNVSTVTRICERFGIHTLVQEDIVNTDQRPKVDEYDGYLFVVLKMLRRHETAPRPEGTTAKAQRQAAMEQHLIEVEQVSLLILDGVIISFQEFAGDVFDPIRNRLRNGKGSLRRRAADYLGYCLLDAIVDQYYILLEQIETRIEPIEEVVVLDPSPEVVVQIQSLKRDLLYLRRSLWPTREMVYRLSREESSMIGADTRLFLRDLYDHVIHVIEILEGLQELASGSMDIYLSSISNRMNSIMKVLTIISTIFIPLTFVAGIYGMNFIHMPELEWPWAYPATLGVMALTALGMLRFFRSKRWI